MMEYLQIISGKCIYEYSALPVSLFASHSKPMTEEKLSNENAGSK